MTSPELMPGVVPIEPVIDRRQLHARLQRVIAPSQQGQVLLQQGRLLPLENKERGGQFAIGGMSVPMLMVGFCALAQASLATSL